MKSLPRFGILACVAAFLVSASALGQTVLYSQNFDADGQAALWTLADGPTDESADYFFDYSTVGVPAAPNSAGTTRGLKIQANITEATFGGSTTSPNEQSFSGDYLLKFDLWSNYLGGEVGGVNVIGTTLGSTNLSTYGILTSGTFANRAGALDGLFFANTGDASTAAIRIYSSERAISYQLPHLIGDPPDPANLDNQTPPQPIDSHATHHAGTRSNNPESTTAPAGQLYLDTFPSVAVPAAQTALFPETQHGSTRAGSVGFAWRAVEIAKVGNTVTWKMNGALLGTVDLTNFVTPTSGTNIMFGHADVNATVSLDPNYAAVNFTLIDNIQVTTIAAGGNDADFDGDEDVDGADFLIWQRTIGAAGGAGDANGDNMVDAADLEIWKGQYGEAPGVAAAGAVPEPAAGLMALAGIFGLTTIGVRRRPVSDSQTRSGSVVFQATILHP